MLTLLAGGASSNIDGIPLDKIIHAFMFMIQSLLIIIGLKKQNTSCHLKFNAVKVAIVSSTIFGIVVELLQGLAPGRSMEFSDMLANFCGSLLGYVFFYLIYRVKLT